MDFGILRALKTVRNYPYVQYVGFGFAGLLLKSKQGTETSSSFPSPQHQVNDFSNNSSRHTKSKFQLIRLSAAVCGIELCYAAETAFVSPILLKLGVPVSLMTLVWCLSPIIGFLLVPVLGSLSDRCPLKIGRRRPFILCMSLGIVIGLGLVPNGEVIGRLLGDTGLTTLHHPKHFVNYNKSTNRDNYKDMLITYASPKTYFISGSQVENDSGHFVEVSRMQRITSFSSHADNKSLINSFRQSERKATKVHRSVHRFNNINKNKYREYYSDKNLIRSDEKAVYTTEAVKNLDNFMNNDENFIGVNENLFNNFFHSHMNGIILTIFGVAILDFNCDACQSPCRAYLLDVSLPEEHSAGLTTFTVMAGLGGTVGYLMGGIDWNSTSVGELFGGHIRVVFTLVIFIFIVSVTSTLTSFKETPLNELNYAEESVQRKQIKVGKSAYSKFTNEDKDSNGYPDGNLAVNNTNTSSTYGTIHCLIGKTDVSNEQQERNTCYPEENPSPSKRANVYQAQNPESFRRVDPTTNKSSLAERNDPVHTQHPNSFPHDSTHHSLPAANNERLSMIPNIDQIDLDKKTSERVEISADVSLHTYLRSIVFMPPCMLTLCLVNLLCWMSLVCYSLFFTDFVGQVIFLGSPLAPPGSPAHNAYDDGVRLGSFGMSLYSLSCSVYSILIEKLVKKFGAKRVYVTGQVVYAIGMLMMAVSRDKVAAILLSPTAGVMYATLFTMPYLLVAHYHSSGLFRHNFGDIRRGLGTDVAVVSSMVFLAQFLLSAVMGTLIHAFGSPTVVIVSSSVLSSLGAIAATQVTYLDL